MTNQSFTVPLIYPDFERRTENNFFEGGNRTTVNAIVRASIYQRLWNDGTVRKRRRVLLRPVASADERSRGARPPRLELGTLPEKASADLDGGATPV